MDIISRAEWGARPPRSRETVSWDRRTEFVQHYSAASPTQTPKIIQDYHMDTRGWVDIGYNFLVSEAGLIYEGRGWTVIGAHATGHNTTGIGVCFIGRDRPDVIDASPAARRAMRWLYDEACRRAGRKLTLRGHRDVGATTCPGDELYAWLRAGMPVDQPAPTPPPVPQPATDWTEQLIMSLPTLKRGSTGTPVRRLQALLNVAGQRLVEDGVFGSLTESAVRAEQSQARIAVDGIAGRQTWTKLLGG